MFVDESGILSEPLVRRTWGLRGRTPVLTARHRHRRKLSVIGALTLSPGRRRCRLLLRWHAGRSVRGPEVLAFLRALLRSVRGRMIVVWDGLPAHHGKAVRELAAASGRVTLERLPGYAPELNPIEGVWGNVKWHRMANHGLTEVDAIHAMAKREGRKVADDQRLLKSFIRATPLPIRLPGR